jgi:hypothetical protein
LTYVGLGLGSAPLDDLLSSHLAGTSHSVLQLLLKATLGVCWQCGSLGLGCRGGLGGSSCGGSLGRDRAQQQ